MPGWRSFAPVLIAALFWAGPVSAQERTPTSPILTIVTEQLYAESLMGRQIEAELGVARAALIAENENLDEVLSGEEQALAEQRASMTPEEFRPLADAFDEKVQLIRAAQEQKQRQLVQDREEARQAFFGQILPVVAQIVQERGALIVMERRVVFIASESVDITAETIARIDAAMAASDDPVLPENENTPANTDQP